MSPVLRDTSLGRLQIQEVFHVYDGPKVFAAEHTTGQWFLAFWLDQKTEYEEWLYVPVSSSRLEVVKSGELSLRQACLSAEDGWVFVGRRVREGQDTVRILRAQELPEEALPGPQAHLQIDVDPLPTRYLVESTLQRALRTRGEVLDLALVTPGRRRSRIVAAALGRALVETQQTITALHLSHQGYRARRGPVPEELVHQSQLHAVATYPSSFGVRLESESIADLLDESPLRRALESFFAILNAEDDADRLSELSDELGGRVFARITALLGAFSSNHVDLNVHWASPTQQEHEVLVTWRSARKRVQRLLTTVEASRERVEIHGRLEGIDVHIKTFDLVDLEDDVRLTGRVADEMIQAADEAVARIPKEYRATIQMTQEVNPVTGEVKERYRLMALW